MAYWFYLVVLKRNLFFISVVVCLKKHQKRWAMNINEDNAGLILNALGLAVVDLIISGTPISRDNLVERLERTRHETGNVIGKGANRDAAELVRKGQ